MYSAALPFVDHVFTVDTGSTDSTIQKASAYGEVRQIPWTNFGDCRTQAFNLARDFFKDAFASFGRDNFVVSSQNYILVLDADMILKGQPFKDLTKPAYALFQKAGTLEYHNVRLMRADLDWVCKGVTHEYWTSSSKEIEILTDTYIDDIGDGGCKADKFQR